MQGFNFHLSFFSFQRAFQQWFHITNCILQWQFGCLLSFIFCLFILHFMLNLMWLTLSYVLCIQIFLLSFIISIFSLNLQLFAYYLLLFFSTLKGMVLWSSHLRNFALKKFNSLAHNLLTHVNMFCRVRIMWGALSAVNWQTLCFTDHWRLIKGFTLQNVSAAFVRFPLAGHNTWYSLKEE